MSPSISFTVIINTPIDILFFLSLFLFFFKPSKNFAVRTLVSFVVIYYYIRFFSDKVLLEAIICIRIVFPLQILSC